jgi:membrane protease YdiL (CAAX protease family)
MDKRSESRNLRLFFILAYAIFWVLLGLTGLLVSLKVPALAVDIMKNVCAWSPTFAVLILWRRLWPGVGLREWLRTNFRAGFRARGLVLALSVQVAILALVVLSWAAATGMALSSLRFLAWSALPGAILVTLTSGPTGEEAGWRAYAYQALRKGHGVAGSAIILGLLWGFWHLPLWLLSGYAGVQLLEYVAAFLVAIVATSVFIAVCYERGRNLLVPMAIHFAFNFLLRLVVIDSLALLAWSALYYAILALGLLLYVRKRTQAQA